MGVRKENKMAGCRTIEEIIREYADTFGISYSTADKEYREANKIAKWLQQKPWIKNPVPC